MIGMRISTVMCNQTWPSLRISNVGLDNMPFHRQPPKMDKLVVVMGATGAGKSRLSVDLATHFGGEIVNSDKIQVYKGLDVATNKITEEERCGIPHHLLGAIDPHKEFEAKNFCDMASLAINSITCRGKLPIIVGGSNSFIEALFYDKTYEVYTRYNFCFLWVDVSMHVLNSFLTKRVDKMVEKGLVNEVRNMFNPKNADYSKGIRKAIGVPEFDRYFRAELSNSVDEETRIKLLEEVINEVKINNCKLASQQLEKIKRLINVKGWNVHRLDATEVYKKRGNEEEEMVEELWKNLVVGQSKRIMDRFLCENYRSSMDCSNDGTAINIAISAMAAASYY
ncbi:adenylate isopentenyltransferase 3, chloroplastic-like [Nicotiana tomentosiformis]|uniref:adenylate isopentenyltransferase 3, chloroplastic-like n=1 Tax=Nicotiana tomentosiformis TaxID=4098 RepID=UPI00051C7E22|nr:adenylate isopentenyltransferase 3, chloroplastic-like [Nicotiana tomentosiformis]